MSSKCKLISLGKTNKYIFLIFSASVCGIFQFYFFSSVGFTSNSIINLNNIFQTVFYSLGLSLSVLLFFIYKKCNKNEKTKISSIILSKRIKTFSKPKKFFWILLISIFDFISNVIQSIFKIDEVVVSLSSWTINFIIMSFCSYCILKIALYKHHYISIIIFFIICIICNIIVLKREDINNFLSFYLYTSLKTIFSSLTYVLFKYFLIKTYIKSFEILFIQGLIELILSSILITILRNCKLINNYEYYWNEIKAKLVFVLLSIFFAFVYYSQLYVIIDFFSPFHIFIVILNFFILVVVFFGKRGVPGLIFSAFIICFGIFFVLVYTEIIELNCFGLSYMTKRNIALRAKLDNDLNEDDDNDAKSDDGIPMEGYIIELKNNMPIELDMLDSNSSKEE